MLDRPAGYHPSAILKEKRVRRAREVAAALAASSAPPVAEAGGTDDQKISGKIEAGQAAKAKAYLEEVADLIAAIESKIAELAGLANSASKSGMNDAEYKALNKDFQVKKKELDALAKTTEIKGDVPLSGRYSQKPKVLRLGEGSASLELKFDALHCQGLGIDSLRIDSLSYGKKAKMELDRAKNTARLLRSALNPKIQMIEGKIASAAVVTKEAGPKISSTDHLEIKIQQERAARAKGRTFALLVNIIV